ncbi:methyltransferase domain-containing protein [Pseudomonas sp. Z1-14]|uniref:methyltransferase domain-containing protein n=1 Tax=Pseudomonas sp. Z1-14 TaxID=2817409 RepID=UPI003DA9BB4A
MNSVQLPPQPEGPTALADIHDRVMEAYYGKLGEHFMRETQARIHWICAQVAGKKVLDVGCSQGIVPLLLAREGCEVVGVDTSPQAIEEAKSYLAAEPTHVQAKICYVNADFLSLDTTETAPDTIVISEVLEHLVRPEMFVEKAAALLKPEGRLIITVPFGVNDFIDHKHTFYLLEPFRLLNEYLQITDIKVLGKWLGMVAIKKSDATAPREAQLDMAQIRNLEKAFEAIERNLQDSLSSTSKNLAEANRKYRAATEQIAELKVQAQRVEELTKQNRAQEALLSEQADIKLHLEEANKKYRAATEQIVELKLLAPKVEELTKQNLAQEASLSKLADIKSRLEDANEKYRAATEHVQLLKQEVQTLTAQNALLREQVAEEQSGRHQAENARISAIHDAEQQRHAHEAIQTRLEQDIDTLLMQVDDLTQRHERETQDLNAQFETERAARQQLELTLNELEHQAQEALLQREELAAVLEQQTSAMAELNQHPAALEELRKQNAELQLRVQMEISSREAANQKYREVAGTQIPRLKANVEKLLEQTTAQRQKIEELSDNLHRANAKRHLAEQRLIKTRSSITYQLGYQLKASASSLGGFVRLPGTLFKLYRQAGKTRNDTTPKAIGFDGRIATLPAPQHTALPAALEDTEHVRHVLLNPKQDNATALKVACIMDEFTYGSYRHECNLLQLTPEDWQTQLEQFQPELLFIESAWRGKDALWGSKVGHNSHELQDILIWCKGHNVPSVFWNKEDPVHFETFLSTAKQFDFVFTSDIDCIHRYKGALGHEQVYLLPFACQPAVHNPVELYERKDAFCFAGAYYARYPERTRDLGNFVSELPRFRPLEIFDRNFGKNDANYQFPAQYQPYIVGTLNFEQIDLAYKGYRYAINLNSIKQSQSMFARRVFELLGSNTVTVSNFSRGMRLLFGDLVITTDSGPEMLRRLNTLAGNERDCDKLRLAALRKVMQEHTYAHRLGYVMSKVTGKTLEDNLPRICVIASAADSAELEALLQQLQRQRYTNVNMHVVVDDKIAKSEVKDPRVNLISRKQLEKISLGELADDAPLFAAMVGEDYYGPNYLLDLALATRYNQAQVIGKVAHYVSDEQGIHLQNPGQAYRSPSHIAARAALIKTALIAEQTAGEWLEQLPTLNYEYEYSLAIDAFNYCRNGSGANEQDVIGLVNDLDLYTGISIGELQRHAEAIMPLEVSHTCAEICGRELAEMFGPIRSKQLKEHIDTDSWQITSSLADGKHEYHYAKQELSVDEVAKGEQLELFLDATPGLNIQLVILFLDAQKQRISHVMQHANRNQTSDIPPETAFIRLGIRAYANGCADIKALVLGHRDLQPTEMLGKSEYLLLTNHYPAYDDLYRNGFVHTRVKAYREQGINVDVFRLRKHESVSYHEFENIDVMTGSQATLSKVLESGTYKTVLVHFLDPDMWEILHRHLDTTKVIVWVHGAEIQPWWRREYNFTTDEQLALGKLDSDKRMSFWRNLLQPMPANLKLVFVSRYFAEEVMEDLGFRLPESQYEIIHNPIDTELFSYVEKPEEQRKKILSIRPYASAKYANDLSVKAIELLAEKPYFSELEFHMIGDGVLFEETLAPLRKFSNVKIERRFMKHAEIAALHKEYGFFLCPTRMDAQGVSRDEAMASGLIPVTNGVTAIPEFVDETCGVLAFADNAELMAQGIARIIESPALFAKLSRAARERVEKQTSMGTIIQQEITLMNKANDQ